MNEEEQMQFIYSVRSFVAKHPSQLAAVVMAAQGGVEDRLQSQLEYAIDMEFVAVSSLNARLFKSNRLAIADRLAKHNKKQCRFEWEDQIKELRK